MFAYFASLPKDTRRVLFTCFFAFFFNGLMTLMMGSILPDLRAAYNLTDSQGGLMLAGHSAGNLAASLLSGLVPLWLGSRRRAIVLLSALAALGYAMLLLFGNPLWLTLAFAITGMSRGSISNFNNGTVNRVTEGNPSASNLLHSFFAAGAISAPLLFLITFRIGGWQAAILAIVVLGAIVALAFTRINLADDRPSRTDSTQKSLVFLRNRTFLLLGGMMFFYLCAEYSINGWLVTYLQHKPALLAQFALAGGDAQQALVTYSQTMATLLWAIILVGRLCSALLSRRLPQKLLMMAGSIGVLVFFAVLLLGDSIALVTLSVAGLGFCLAGICPMIYSDASYITNLYPMGTSAILGIGSIGAIIMPALVGIVADAYGFAGGMSAILIGVVALVVLAILNYILKPAPMQQPGTAQPQA